MRRGLSSFGIITFANSEVPVPSTGIFSDLHSAHLLSVNLDPDPAFQTNMNPDQAFLFKKYFHEIKWHFNILTFFTIFIQIGIGTILSLL
jgi:hypothetical protein